MTTTKTITRIAKLNSEEIKLFKIIACSNDIKILTALGIKITGTFSIKQKCPIHNGDNPGAFSYNTDKCCWSCFTHHCEQKYGNDIIGLVRGVLSLSFVESIDWINKIIGSDSTNVNEVKIEVEKKKTFNTAISDARLKKLNKNHPYIKSRDFSIDTCEFFESGVLDKGKYYHHRLMIPIRDLFGNLVGITGRSIYNKNADGWYYPDRFNIDENYKKLFCKWKNYPRGLNKSTELYNIHNSKQEIKDTGICIIVEGPFDCWRLHSFGLNNVVAILGSTMSNRQIETLISCGAKHLLLALDSDKAGKEATQRIQKIFSKTIKISTIILDEKDPEQMKISDYRRIIKPQIEAIINENKDYNTNR